MGHEGRTKLPPRCDSGLLVGLFLIHSNLPHTFVQLLEVSQDAG